MARKRKEGLADLIQGHFLNGPPFYFVGTAHHSGKSGIVRDHDFSVGGSADVHLNSFTSLIHRTGESGHGVFRTGPDIPSVGDPGRSVRESFWQSSIFYFFSHSCSFMLV